MATAPPPGTARDIGMVQQAHADLLQHLVDLGDDLDVGAPSRLPSWTKGHVLAHVVNSGDGHVGLFDGAAAGEVREQYPGGREQRSADIEAGAGRPADVQIASLREACAALEGRYAESDWEGAGRGPLGEIALVDLPFFRMREVAIHHVDLDIGYEFADLPSVYVRLELRRMEMMWQARQPMGLTPLPPAALELAPPARVAWLMGRIEVPGLKPANVW